MVQLSQYIEHRAANHEVVNYRTMQIIEDSFEDSEVFRSIPRERKVVSSVLFTGFGYSGTGLGLYQAPLSELKYVKSSLNQLNIDAQQHWLVL